MATNGAVSRRSIILLMMLLMTITPIAGMADGARYTEDELKAGFLFNFLRFVRWPDGAEDGPFVVSILAAGGLLSALEQVVGSSTVQDRSIVIQGIDSVDEIGACHLLFIPDDQIQSMPQILAEVAGHHTLVVTESEGAAADGAAINLVRDGERLRLEVNKQASDRAGLRLSPQLLKVSTIVASAEASP